MWMTIPTTPFSRAHGTHEAGSASWFRVNGRFSLTLGRDPFLDLSELELWQTVQSDLTLLSVPPLFLLKDVTQVLQHHTGVELREIGLFQEDLLHAYRNRFVYHLIYRDASITQLSRILIGKTRSERRYFVPFVVRACARTVMKIYSFPFGKEPADPAEPGRSESELAFHLARFLDAFGDCDRLFSAEQVHMFSYVRREEDLPIVREYGRAKHLLRPTSARLAKLARSSHSLQVEVDDAKSPSMGGFSGITTGGNIEKITSVLPSQLAMMEKGYAVDLFDVNLLENRLVSFLRDRFLDARRYREFHVLFLSPEALDSKPHVIPFRWQYLFLAMLFDIIRFYRDYFDVRRYPFYFVFPNHVDQAVDVLQLLDIVHNRDFADIAIETHCLTQRELAAYTARMLGANTRDKSVLSFSGDGSAVPLEAAHEADHTVTTYGEPATATREQLDEIQVRYTHKQTERLFGFPVEHVEGLPDVMAAVRDTLFLCVSGAVAQGG